MLKWFGESKRRWLKTSYSKRAWGDFIDQRIIEK